MLNISQFSNHLNKCRICFRKYSEINNLKVEITETIQKTYLEWSGGIELKVAPHLSKFICSSCNEKFEKIFLIKLQESYIKSHDIQHEIGDSSPTECGINPKKKQVKI